MNNIASFLAQLGGSTGSVHGQKGLVNTSGETAPQNLAFWQALFTQVTADNAANVTSTSPQGPIPLLKLLSDENAVDISDILEGATPRQLKQLDQKLTVLKELLDNAGNLSEAQAERFEKLQEQGLNISQLSDRIDTLKKQIELLRTETAENSGDEFPLYALIASGLSPSEITKVIARMEALEEKLGRKLTLEDLIAGVGGVVQEVKQETAENQKPQKESILPEVSSVNDNTVAGAAIEAVKLDAEEPALTQEEIELQEEAIREEWAKAPFPFPAYVAQIVQAVKQGEAVPDDTAIGQSIKAIIESVKAGQVVSTEQVQQAGATSQTEEVIVQKVLSEETVVAGLEIPLAVPQTTAQAKAADFADKSRITPMQNGIQTPQSGQQQNTNSNLQGQANGQNAPSPQAQGQANAQPPVPLQGFTLVDGIPAFTDGDIQGFMHQALHPSSNVTQAANVITQSNSHAGQPHPAAQLVSAKLQQGAQAGENKVMTLQLDPAELGKVEIRLEFGPEKTLKAHMVVEKPEAFLLLQRDAQMLERALQGAGMDVDSSGIGFELAEEGWNFGQDNNGKGGGEKFNGGAAGNEGDDLPIETTMTWNIDPDTGHTRYNLLA